MLVVTETKAQSNEVPSLYRHSKRDGWGLAALVWEREGKRGYRFEDGNERAFQEGYYHLFDPVVAVGEAAEKLLASVERDRLEASNVKAGILPLPDRGPALDELIAVFRETFHDGFADSKWTSKHRGEGVKRRAKRHRDEALRDAASRLGRVELDSLIEAGHFEALVGRTVEVLRSTDLVNNNQLAVLEEVDPTRDLATALRNLMHEPDPEGIRFDDLLKLLARSGGGRPSWQLLSALRVLADPHHDTYIRPSVFFSGLRSISPSQARKVSPQGRHYNRLVALARELRDQLRAAGEVPRDMFDVCDFIWITCRAAAAPVLARIRKRVATEEAARPVEALQAAPPTPSPERSQAVSSTPEIAEATEVEAEAA